MSLAGIIEISLENLNRFLISGNCNKACIRKLKKIIFCSNDSKSPDTAVGLCLSYVFYMELTIDCYEATEK